jgi:hypothetical protein
MGDLWTKELSLPWEMLNPSQKQWFQDQWSQGNTPNMENLPGELGPKKPENIAKWHELINKKLGQEPGYPPPPFKEPPPSIGDDFPEMPPGVKPGEYWKTPPERHRNLVVCGMSGQSSMAGKIRSLRKNDWTFTEKNHQPE